ncbi:MAG: hypothetical protein JSS02_10820, partial [Planctomycetes bacterium]|nr:hypothetical protein [Planctomycetota bacterium]
SPDEEDNVLRRHVLARDALRGKFRADPPSGGTPTRSDTWRKAFDEYKISHVVIRLAYDKDYDQFVELIQQPTNWEWTGLGASAVVFYRARVQDVDKKAYQAFLAEHKLDLRKLAFDDETAESDAEQIRSGRLRSISPPSFYKKYFWSNKVESSAEIREAMQYATLASINLPRLMEARVALAQLAIRKAQVGLSKDPDDVRGYLALGQAYDLLSQVEYGASLGQRNTREGLRYLQIISAYNQVLVGEPDNMPAHRRLMQIYAEARKVDLCYRHAAAIDDDILAHPENYAEEYSKAVAQQIKALNEALKVADQAASKAGPDSADSKILMNRMQSYLQHDCLARGLAELEKDSKATAGNPQMEQMRIRLLLETGRVQEANLLANQFAAMAEMQGASSWAENIAVVLVAAGEYDNAVKYLNAGSNEYDKVGLGRLVLSLPPRTVDPQAPWPFSITNAAATYFMQTPEQSASLKLNAALCMLESGRIKDALQAFHEVLEISPDTTSRPLVRFYIAELTSGKEIVDIVQPSNRIPELFAPEPGTENPAEGDNAAEVKPAE